MSDSTSLLVQVEPSQAQKEVTVNNLFDAMSAASFGARRAEACSLLTWGYYGGRWGGTLVANGTLSLTASSTCYIVAARLDGAISFSVASTNWDNTNDYRRLYKAITNGTTVTSWEDHRAGPGGFEAPQPIKILSFAVGDETTDLEVAADVVTLRADQAMTLLAGHAGVRAHVNVAPTGAALQVDIKVGGASILSTKLHIDIGETTSMDSSTTPVISSTSVADNALVQVSILQIGSTIPGAGLKISMRGV